MKKLPPKAQKRIVLAGPGPRVHAVRDRHHHLRRPGARAGLAAEGTPRRRRRRRRGDLSTRSRTAGRCSPTRATSSRAARSWSRRARSATVIEGREFIVRPAFDEKIEDYLRRCSRRYYTMSFDNYPVEMERLRARRTIRACKRPTLDRAMITLTLKEQPIGPARSRGPLAGRDGAAAHDAIRALPVFLGKRQCRLDDFFDGRGRRPATSWRSAATPSRSSGSAAA